MIMDSGMKQILLAHCYNLKVIYLHQFRISVDFFLLGPAENSCQEWTTVTKEDTFINFHLNTTQKLFLI